MSEFHIEGAGVLFFTGIVPTVLTSVLNTNVFVLSIVFSNDSGAVNPHVTILDRDTPARIFHFGRDVPISRGNGVPWACPFDQGWLAVGGLQWVCDTANAVVGRIAYLG